jgi:imidazolonepropionase-like amidohydrolase
MTRHMIFAVLVVLISLPLAAQERLAFSGATIVDGTGNEPITNGIVVVEEGKITAVGKAEDVLIPAGARTIDLEGKWIIPGLIDPHIHFFQSGGLYTRPDIVDLRGTVSYEDEMKGINKRLDATFRRYLASGITAVVDVGGPFWNFDVRERARTAKLAPQVAVAGPLVSTVPRPQMDIGDPPIIKVEGPDAARELVKKQLEYKPDLIKIWFILPASGDVNENLETIKATIDEAHQGGVRVAVHATQLETARAAVLAGADILVHSVDDKPVDDEFIKLVKDNGVIYTTTLIVYEGYAEVLAGQPALNDIEKELGDPSVIKTWAELDESTGGLASKKAAAERLEKLRKKMPVMQANLKLMWEAGVLVAAGTDAGNIGTLHGPSLHREFELMAEAGLTPAEILVTATRNAALVFAKDPGFGTISEGMRADMVVLDADPLVSVENWRKIRRVVLNGEMLEPARILLPSPETVVQRQVDAYNARDIEAFLSFYADDIVIRRLPEGTSTMKGLELMRERYASFFNENPDLNCHIMKRIVTGNYVVDHEFVTGIKKRPRLRAVAIYEVEGDKIERVWFLPKE